MGPDTDKSRFVSVEVVGGAKASRPAKVAGAMARWLLNKPDAEDFERVD
jgi:hypothetical protein